MEFHVFTTAAAAASDSNTCGHGESPRASEQGRTISATIEIPANNIFPSALKQAMQFGHRITRAGWNARGQWVAAQRPEKGSKMSAPYLYLKNAQGDLVPWLPSQGDLFAEDWAVLPA